VFGDPRVDFGALQIQPAHIRKDASGEVASDCGLVLTEVVLADTGGYLLVHVGDVLDMSDVEALVFEPPVKYVCVSPHPGMAEMSVVRDGEATDVEQNLVALNLERFCLARQRVPHRERHRLLLSRAEF